MSTGGRKRFIHSQRQIIYSLICILASAGLVAAVAPMGAAASARPAAQAAKPYFSVAQDYTIRFYPRLLTYLQQLAVPANSMVGPNTVGPVAGFVVAPNVDTLYAGMFNLNLSKGPEILTIPKTKVTYSILNTDVFGDVIPTNIPPQTPGTFALALPSWKGTLPHGITRVNIPYPVTAMFFRADKYSSTNQNQIAQATAFRASLRLASLPVYKKDPLAGATKVVPEALLYPRMKAIAQRLILVTTTSFFRIMQAALRPPTVTAPLSKSDLQLSMTFNKLHAAATAAAKRGNVIPLAQMIRGARAAYAMILQKWLSLADANHWIYQSNFGEWGTDYLGRAAGNVWIQLGNNAAAAGYYNVFTDGSGAGLNGARASYRLTFSKSQLPNAKRFWSLTAYIGPGNTLVPNAARKYEVAKFTPGLVTSLNGSVTIYIQAAPPPPAFRANWLPVPRGAFNLLLRVYGPTGNTSPGSKYIPPKIQRVR
jgi:hypothetical protein